MVAWRQYGTGNTESISHAGTAGELQGHTEHPGSRVKGHKFQVQTEHNRQPCEGSHFWLECDEAVICGKIIDARLPCHARKSLEGGYYASSGKMLRFVVHR